MNVAAADMSSGIRSKAEEKSWRSLDRGGNKAFSVAAKLTSGNKKEEATRPQHHGASKISNTSHHHYGHRHRKDLNQGSAASSSGAGTKKHKHAQSARVGAMHSVAPDKNVAKIPSSGTSMPSKSYKDDPDGIASAAQGDKAVGTKKKSNKAHHHRHDHNGCRHHRKDSSTSNSSKENKIKTTRHHHRHHRSRRHGIEKRDEQADDKKAKRKDDKRGRMTRQKSMHYAPMWNDIDEYQRDKKIKQAQKKESLSSLKQGQRGRSSAGALAPASLTVDTLASYVRPYPSRDDDDYTFNPLEPCSRQDKESLPAGLASKRAAGVARNSDFETSTKSPTSPQLEIQEKFKQVYERLDHEQETSEGVCSLEHLLSSGTLYLFESNDELTLLS